MIFKNENTRNTSAQQKIRLLLSLIELTWKKLVNWGHIYNLIDIELHTFRQYTTHMLSFIRKIMCTISWMVLETLSQ